MTRASADPSAGTSSQRVAEVARLFLKLGLTAFGGPAAHIAMMRTEVVERRGWVSNERFVDLMGIASAIPGPTSTEMAIYLGYLHAGGWGLVVGGLCFIVPAMLMVMALGWVYVTFGSLPQTGWIFYGIQPVVVAIVAQAIWVLGRIVIKGVWPALLTVGILTLYLLGVNIFLLLLGGALFIALLGWMRRTPKQEGLVGISLLRWQPAAWSGAVALTVVPFSLLLLFLTFLKIGAVIYGSGYVLLAFLRTDLVLNLHWLTDQQLLDAVAVGQLTPGPVFTTATFIGYILGGPPGALLATVAIFLPSFLFIALIHPLAGRLRGSALAAPFLDGLNVAALGLMAGVLIQLGQHALIDGLTVFLAVESLVVLLRLRLNSAWLILVGAIVGYIHFAWHIF